MMVKVLHSSSASPKSGGLLSPTGEGVPCLPSGPDWTIEEDLGKPNPPEVLEGSGVNVTPGRLAAADSLLVGGDGGAVEQIVQGNPADPEEPLAESSTEDSLLRPTGFGNPQQEEISHLGYLMDGHWKRHQRGYS